MRRRARRSRRRREVLLRELGALVVEMRRLGRENPELVGRKAAEVVALDEELVALRAALGERQTVEEVVAAGVAGSCARCGTLLGSDDRFCSHCGLEAGAEAVSPAGDAASPAGDAASPATDAVSPAEAAARVPEPVASPAADRAPVAEAAEPAPAPAADPAAPPAAEPAAPVASDGALPPPRPSQAAIDKPPPPPELTGASQKQP